MYRGHPWRDEPGGRFAVMSERSNTPSRGTVVFLSIRAFLLFRQSCIAELKAGDRGNPSVAKEEKILRSLCHCPLCVHHL